jgi:hypothetical protein
MNVKKETSGNIEQAYENIVGNKNQTNYKMNLNNRKQPLNNYYSFNRAPDYSKFNQMSNNYPEEQNAPQKEHIKRYDTNYINLEENINIDDYIKQNEKRNKKVERSPPVKYNANINKKRQDDDYYNKKKSIRNYYKNERNKNIKHYQSENLEDNYNENYEYNNDNKNQNWKQKFEKINEEKQFKYYKTKYNKFISAKKIEYNDNQSDYSDKILSQSVNVDKIQPKSFNSNHKNNNYQYIRENNINFVDDYNQNYNDDSNSNYNDLSENSYKNQTYQNYYCPDYNNFTNETSSINSYDSYELNKTENYAGKAKDKLYNISKFLNPYSQESESNEYYNDDDALSADVFRRPMKNDEKHYHQNLTIKIQKKDEKKKKRKSNVNGRGLKQAQNIDNETDEGCDISTNTDLNKKIKEKKINTFRLKAKMQKNKSFKPNNLYSDLNYSNNSENYSNLSSTTVFVPSRKRNNNLVNINDNDYFQNRNKNKNRSPNIINDNNKMRLNNDINDIYNNDNIYYQHDSFNQNNHMKGRSPGNYYYKNDSNYFYNNNEFPLKNYNSMNSMNKQKFMNNQNKIQDNFYANIPKDKRIKEITVNLSPKKKIKDLSNSNGNIIINNKINNITPNFNYNINDDNKINNITPNYNFDINNIDNNQNDYNLNIIAKPKSKIESCIITFDKPKNKNNNKPFKLSSSLDGIKYKKKRIPKYNKINNKKKK